MIIGFYDADYMRHPDKKLYLPKYDFLKLGGYYSARRDIIYFMSHLKEPWRYDKIYYRQDEDGDFPSVLSTEDNIDYAGYAFTKDNETLPNKIESSKNNLVIYGDFYEKLVTPNSGQERKTDILESSYVKLSAPDGWRANDYPHVFICDHNIFQVENYIEKILTLREGSAQSTTFELYFPQEINTLEELSIISLIPFYKNCIFSIKKLLNKEEIEKAYWLLRMTQAQVRYEPIIEYENRKQIINDMENIFQFIFYARQFNTRILFNNINFFMNNFIDAFLNALSEWSKIPSNVSFITFLQRKKNINHALIKALHQVEFNCKKQFYINPKDMR